MNVHSLCIQSHVVVGNCMAFLNVLQVNVSKYCIDVSKLIFFITKKLALLVYAVRVRLKSCGPQGWQDQDRVGKTVH